MMEEEHFEEEKKGVWKIFLGLFLIFIIVLWAVPYYGVKQNPEPVMIPSIEEVGVPQMSIPVVSGGITSYVQTTSEIKKVADKIIALSCKETHRVCIAKAMFYFVQQNFKYVNDPLVYEYYKTPQEAFHSSVGDCDDSSILLSSLLQSVGFRTRFVFVPGHVYVQVYLPEATPRYKDAENWVDMDATCVGCGFGEVHYSYASKNKKYVE